MKYRSKTINQLLETGHFLKKKQFNFGYQKEILLWLNDIYYYLNNKNLDGHNFIKIVFDDVFKYRLVHHGSSMTTDNAKNHLLDLLNLLDYYYDQGILVD